MLKKLLTHSTISAICLLFFLPIVAIVLIAASLDSDILANDISKASFSQFFTTFYEMFFGDYMQRLSYPPAWVILYNTLVMTVSICLFKTLFSLLSAYALVFFRFKGNIIAFILILIAGALPLETRFVSTYLVCANVLAPLNWLFNSLGFTTSFEWNILDSYSGLIIPLIPSAAGTYLFRQTFLNFPNDLVEASHIDCCKPIRFFTHILVPLSRSSIAAFNIVMFVWVWNQFLWPFLVISSKPYATVATLFSELTQSANFNLSYFSLSAMFGLLTLVPPTVIIILFQREFIKGLIQGEK